MTGPKRRHGCLTAWLILLVTVNAASALVNLTSGSFLRQILPAVPSWFAPVSAAIALLNVAFAIALLAWRRWGFWGYLGTSAAAIAANAAIGLGVGQLLFGLVGIAVLYGVLQIGDQDKGWPQLE